MENAATIKNIGVLAHVDAGKTTLTEQMLYACGAIRQAGSVDDGTAQTDWLDIERRRGISVRAAQASLVWRGYTVNLLDTPGHLDFAGEVERSLAALDGAVLVVSAVEGVQSHTENLWRALESSSCRVFCTSISSTARAAAPGRLSGTPRAAGRLFPAAQRGGFLKGDRDCAVRDDGGALERLTEAAAEFDDGIAERWLEGETIPREEIVPTVAGLVRAGLVTPVVFGCARQGLGVTTLLDAVTAYLPSADANARDALSALVLRWSMTAAWGSSPTSGCTAGAFLARYRAPEKRRGADGDRPAEKIAQIRKFNGQRYVDAGRVAAGDIAALCGLSGARVGDYIGSSRPGGAYALANPFFRVKALPADPSKLTALVTALRELSDEEPLMNCRWEKSEREIDINITGEIQLEVISALLRERYGLEAVFSPPAVIYKETPVHAAEGFEAYTMPKPCWAVVRFLLEPLPRQRRRL